MLFFCFCNITGNSGYSRSFYVRILSACLHLFFRNAIQNGIKFGAVQTNIPKPFHLKPGDACGEYTKNHGMRPSPAAFQIFSCHSVNYSHIIIFQHTRHLLKQTDLWMYWTGSEPLIFAPSQDDRPQCVRCGQPTVQYHDHV